MERDTPGLEAALPAPTLIREDRTQPGKCYDSFSSTRSHSKKDKHNVSTDKRKFSGGAPLTRYGERALCRRLRAKRSEATRPRASLASNHQPLHRLNGVLTGREPEKETK